jgi:23S rRNA (uridine2552-2'-O)-methyltransferase
VNRRNPYAGADSRTRAAKAQGYPARSVFKLEEIDRRVRLLRPGQRVLDLGAAPGSWSLYASGRVGERGQVLAIDLTPIQQAFPPNVQVLTGDASTQEDSVLARFAPYDVVLSDMAPNTSGNKIRDQARSTELFLLAFEIAARLGKPGSGFVGKIFMSGDFPDARRRVDARYEKVQIIRPEGTRRESSEVFVVGQGLTVSAPNQSPAP